MKKSFCTRLALLLLIAWLPIAQAADDLVTLNFVNSDIESAIKAVGVITGKNFVIDPKVKGTINIVSNQPVARELIYPILLSALRQQGFTAVDTGSIVKVMPEADAKLQSVQVLNRQGKSSGDRLVTQVYPLTYESASQLANTLRPLVSPNNLIAAYQGNNTLVITDYADNVARIGRIIDNIDQPPNNEVFSLPIKHASALDIAQTIARLMPEVLVQGVASPMTTPEGVRRTVVVSDIRGNQLLVRSEAASHTRQIKSLVASLDTPAASGSNINVVYLRNAEAVRLANTLKGILTGQDGGSAQGSGSGFTSVASGSNSFPSTTANATANSNSAAQSASVNVQVGGATVLIQADGMTNSLIITAPDHIYNNLRSVIDKLDVRRAQIYIEALIAEVNVSKATELGVQWIGGGGNDKISLLNPNGLSTNGNLASLLASKAMSPAGFSLGFFNGDPLKGEATLGLLASAIEKAGDGNILSTPNLLMLDNEEAKITVGQNIPIVTGSYATTAGSSTNPFTTVERKDIGIKLKVKPQVSEAGTITLTVSQEVSNIGEKASASSDVITNVRTIDTKVLVDDGQIIVLGGLIEEKLTLSNNKVPLLGDIPLLGNLFKYETQGHEKVNLMVFLRPVILRDAKSINALSSERYEYLRNEQGKFVIPKNMLLDALPKVQLPPQKTAPADEPKAEADTQ